MNFICLFMKKYTSTPLRILHKLCFEQLDIYVYLDIVSINSHVNCTGANWIPAYQPVITIYPYFLMEAVYFIHVWFLICFLAIFFPFACMDHWFVIWFVNTYTSLNWVWCTMKIQQHFNLLNILVFFLYLCVYTPVFMHLNSIFCSCV